MAVMLQGSSDIIALATALAVIAVVVAFWRRPWYGLVFTAPIIIVGWVLLTRANEADIQHELRLIEAKQTRGEQLSLEDGLFDGTGDRIAVLLTGWVPGAVGLGLGGGIAVGLRRLRGRSDSA